MNGMTLGWEVRVNINSILDLVLVSANLVLFLELLLQNSGHLDSRIRVRVTDRDRQRDTYRHKQKHFLW